MTTPAQHDDSKILDARAKPCPYPVVLLGKYARTHPDTPRVTVLASDPAAQHDIPAWCRMTGNHLASCTATDDYWVFCVVLNLNEPTSHASDHGPP